MTSLLSEWGIDVEEREGRRRYSGRSGPKSPRVARHLVFSMPAGTNAKKVLRGVQQVAQGEWSSKHRYLMALHIDTPRPHVHVFVKSRGEDGSRLNLDRVTLKRLRREFSRHLRAQGVDANATDRAERGISGGSKKEGIYWAARRGESTFMRRRVEEAVAALSATRVATAEPGKEKLLATRQDLEKRCRAVSAQLRRQGEFALADRVDVFANGMSPVRTDQERLVFELLARMQASKIRDVPQLR